MTKRSKEERAYEHTDEVVGSPTGETPSTEHQDTTATPASSTNELTPQRRSQEGKSHGPETHQATRTVRKAEE